MPSRAERWRAALEWMARGALLATLLALAVREQGAPPPGASAAARGAAIAGELDTWTHRAPSRLDVTFDSAPTPATRDWLAALARAGTPVTWRARGLAPLAVIAERAPGPDDVVRVSVAAPDDVSVAVGDGGGTIDTVRTRDGGGTVEVPSAWGRVRATLGTWRAEATPPEAIEPRRVLVLGSAGWESKFVVAALEEAGWMVDASLAVRPDAQVMQGIAGKPDTARHAAVIVLDSISSAMATQVAAYVRSGGGGIIAPGAWDMPAFRDLLPGHGARAWRVGPAVVRHTLATLPARSIRVFPSAVVLVRRGSEPVVAARRAGSGRVLQLGILESWRWRMTGPPGAVADHRTWWSHLVASVAFDPAPHVPAVAGEAPTARLVAALGPPSPGGAREVHSPASTLALSALLFMLLLVEVGSRRLRGLP